MSQRCEIYIAYMVILSIFKCMSSCCCFRLSLLLSLSCSFISGQTTQPIVWGTSFEFGSVIASDGSALTLDEFSFELGSFGLGFEPTASNTDEWLQNWKVFDAITSPDTDTSDGLANNGGASSFFAGSASVNLDRTSDSEDANPTDQFAAGEQAYVFIRNDDVPEFGSEWLLYTSDSGTPWVFPGGFAEHLLWSLGDADTVVWGAVNDSTIGAGEFTDSSTEFFVRTHGFEGVSIPEPTSLSLCGVAALFLSRRKRG